MILYIVHATVSSYSSPKSSLLWITRRNFDHHI